MMRLLKKTIKPLVTQPALARRLCRWFLVADNALDRFLNELVCYTEAGIHPKHRLMDYHRFFVKNIGSKDRVLDVGCGRGIVAHDLAKVAHTVVGMDLNEKNIAWASAHYKSPNLSFVVGDALKEVPPGRFDVIVLSNVLEHIDDRVPFLKSIRPLAPKILVRVPMIDRDWKVLYKKELGVDYRLDDTHFVEYTEEMFTEELRAAGLRSVSRLVRFGELWAVTEPA